MPASQQANTTCPIGAPALPMSVVIPVVTRPAMLMVVHHWQMRNSLSIRRSRCLFCRPGKSPRHGCCGGHGTHSGLVSRPCTRSCGGLCSKGSSLSTSSCLPTSTSGGSSGSSRLCPPPEALGIYYSTSTGHTQEVADLIKEVSQGIFISQTFQSNLTLQRGPEGLKTTLAMACLQQIESTASSVAGASPYTTCPMAHEFNCIHSQIHTQCAADNSVHINRPPPPSPHTHSPRITTHHTHPHTR